MGCHVIANSYISSTKLELGDHNGEVFISPVDTCLIPQDKIYMMFKFWVTKLDSINIYSNPKVCVIHFKVEPWLKMHSLSSRNIWVSEDFIDKQTDIRAKWIKEWFTNIYASCMQKGEDDYHLSQAELSPTQLGDSHWDQLGAK